MDTADLLERTSEIETLELAIKRALDGEGRLLLIDGAAGIGKTALLEACLQLGRHAGMRELSARCAPMEASFPHGVTRQLFDDLLRHDPARAEDWLTGSAGHALPALGAAQVAPPPDALAALNHGLYWLVANLAEERPLVIAVDDAHWSDHPSMSFLQFLGRRVSELPVAVVATARRGEGGVQDTIDEIRSDDRHVIVSPSPLSRLGTSEFLIQTTQQTPGKAFADACHEATGGNPFLLTELARLLSATEVELATMDAGHIRTLAPSAVAQSVELRLARLGKADSATAQAVAVLETQARLTYAAALAGLPIGEIRAAADRLVSMGIFRDELPVRFVHPLVRQSVYGAIPVGRRSEMHAIAARRLYDDGDPDRAALHLLSTEAESDPWVVDLLRDAAKRALTRGAPVEASTLLRRALAEPPCASDRAQVTAELGLAAAQAGQPDGPSVLLQAMAGTTDPESRARLATEVASAQAWFGDYAGAFELLVREADTLAGTSPDSALMVEAALVNAAALTTESQRVTARVAGRVDALTGRTENERALLAAVAVQRAAWPSAPAEEIARLLDDALADCDLRTPAQLLFPAATYRLLDLNDRADRLAGLVGEQARATGSPAYAVSVSYLRGVGLLWRGEVVPAIDEFEDILAKAHVLGPGPLYTISAVLSALHLEHGDTRAAASVFERSGLWEAAPDPVISIRRPLLTVRSLVRTQIGMRTDALVDARLAAAQLHPNGGLANGSVFSCALALRAAGADIDEVRDEAQREARYADTLATDSARGAARLVLGLTGPPAEGIDRFAEAVALLGRSPRRLEEAKALAELGAALRRSNRRADARDPLVRAMDLAHRCGAHPLAVRVREELQLCGFRPRKMAVSGLEALTPAERKVCRLAARGHSNVEVAQELFVTRKTVETHLSRAFQKLGITVRGELAALFDGE